MQRTIEISFEGKESSFQVTRIERSKLYGSKRRIPIDAHGHECAFASLTRDGKFILPHGSTSLLYLDENGEVENRSELQAVDQNGKAVINGKPEEILEIGETVQAADLLDFTITHAYYLDPVFLTSGLGDSLSSGTTYFLPHFHTNGDDNRHAFLLGNDTGYFIILGQKTGFDFIGLSEADLSPPDMDGDESGENLDFSMW